MLRKFRQKFIGDRVFYKNVLSMVVPMILQNLVTNLVSLVDNVMVGQVGTEQMSGVSIVNQFIFIFNITIFGAVSGPGIFGAQFFGKRDFEGQKQTFRFRVLVCSGIIIIGAVLFSLFDSQLISLFLSRDDSAEQTEATLGYGKEYMSIMIFGLIPFGIGQAYASVVRECGETKIPMIGAFSAVGINVFLDYALIFGKFGLPEMGVKGAAAATVISKCIEALVVIVWAHTHPDRNKYLCGAYRHFRIPKKLAADMTKKGFPLLMNEFLWAAGMSLVAQCYSVRGLDAVAARNITLTISDLFSTVYVQLGACIAILVGRKLGANKLREARILDNKLLFFSVSVTFIIMIFLLPLARFFPLLYNTSSEVRSLASFMIMIQAFTMPMWSFNNASYFTLRSGGKTFITFLFDFGFTWLFMIPLAFILAYCTGLGIRPLFAVVTLSEVIKVVIGFFMVKSDVWINNIVMDE